MNQIVMSMNQDTRNQIEALSEIASKIRALKREAKIDFRGTAAQIMLSQEVHETLGALMDVLENGDLLKFCDECHELTAESQRCVIHGRLCRFCWERNTDDEDPGATAWRENQEANLKGTKP